MEELWRDIALSAVTAATASTSLDLGTSNPSCDDASLQDFLAGPLNRPLVLPPPTPLPPSPAEGLGLCLNSAPADFNDTNASMTAAAPPHAPQFDAYFCPANSSSGFSSTGGSSTRDHRHKRMIKNRESAARSRARKQAYTNELEIEVAHLLEENAKLKKQYEEWQLLNSYKNTHQRSSSSPF
ncbi:bZIP transcription factor 27-like isoform X2 [Ananas comosus]|uniref:BZIP transcription factor 27-like isoform X2 n=1 Tax=Ananas comosus TaxID=4615 RepID=A0A6P5EVF4_ANACO|nr:bZIP transcription factor 27-like isoform X2 [Ananas comosus]